MDVSVHDTVPVWRGDTHGAALRRTIELAQTVEELGYKRYWVAEHHGTPALATSSPAVLAGPILERTSTLHVGSGAVLLPNHAPLVVAEQFGVLASLYPGRVDLGIGRATGGSPAASARLGDPRGRDFSAQYRELRQYFTRQDEEVHAVPEPEVPPRFWMVGSSTASAVTAARLGLPYVFAHAIAPGGAPEALRVYRSEFVPSADLPEPYAGVAAIVVAADTDDRAHSLARAFALGQLRMRTVSATILLPTEQEATAHTFTRAEAGFIREKITPQFVGSPASLAPRIDALLKATAADELFALSQIPGREARIRSYELLAKVVSAL